MGLVLFWFGRIVGRKRHSYVAYYGFPNSNRVIREIAESAFDEVFNKPIFSKDKSVVQKRTEPC